LLLGASGFMANTCCELVLPINQGALLASTGLVVELRSRSQDNGTSNIFRGNICRFRALEKY